MKNGIAKILVVLDVEQDNDYAALKAVAIAERSAAKLEFFVCAYSRSLVGSYLFDNEAKVHAEHGYLHGQEKRLDELAARLVPEHIEVATDVSWNSHSEDAILQKIERYRPDLVIKACPYHHRIDEYLLGSLEEQLIRHCPKPLLLVKPKEWEQPLNLVAAVDPLHDHQKPESMDATIISHALYFCELTQGSLSLFHSFQPLPASVIFDDTLVLDYEAFKEKMSSLHAEAMEQLVEELSLGDDIPRYLAQGEVYQVLPEYLQTQKAGLVVMGAVDRSGLDRLFLGGTAAHTLDHLDCDLLVVKT